LKEELFIRSNSNTWRELEDLSNIINKKGLKSLPSVQVKRFLHIFRQCSHHLAYARTHFPQSNTVNYLNSLVGKCHSHVYAVKKVPFKTFIKYICIDFPSLLRQCKWFITASFGFFVFGAILAMLLVYSNPDNAKYFLDPAWVEGIKEGHQGGGQWNYPLMSSYIMVNNIRVSLLAFVLGLTLGLGTIYVLFINGALLGALTALIYMYGNPTHYWSLILPHGVIELTAIFIAGAAGLMLARGILLPGELTRWHSLIKGAKNAVLLILGVIILLVIAGIIEGFYTPLDISEISKLVFAALTGLGLAVYFAVPYLLKNKKTEKNNKTEKNIKHI
jgi:uncharacterized membrane protein SpoIIM required for sporulation